MAHGITEDYLQDVNNTVAALHREGAPRIGVVGFCLGGAIAVASLSHRLPHVTAAVSFSGTPYNIGKAAKIELPLQAHFGSASTAGGFSDSRAIVSLSSHTSHVYTYDGAGHMFMNNHPMMKQHRRQMKLGGDDSADIAAATLAWSRALEFLDSHIKTAVEQTRTHVLESEEPDKPDSQDVAEEPKKHEADDATEIPKVTATEVDRVAEKARTRPETIHADDADGDPKPSKEEDTDAQEVEETEEMTVQTPGAA